MAKVPSTRETLNSNYKPICTLLPYAIRLEQGGEREMVDAIMHAARASGPIFRWPRIVAHIAPVFDKYSPPSLNLVITLISPYVPWHPRDVHTRKAVARWAVAVSGVPYSEEIGQSVVSALLLISANEFLRSSIPVNIWTWLKKRPSLPFGLRGQLLGFWESTLRHVQGLGDIEILKSYLFLFWSEHEYPDFNSLFEMQTFIKDSFDGIEMRCHRDDLIKHLDHVQGQLDRGMGYLQQHDPLIDEERIQWRKERYGELKNLLLDMDKTPTGTLTRTPPALILFDLRTNFWECIRSPFNFRLSSASSVTAILLLERLVSLPRAHTSVLKFTCRF